MIKAEITINTCYGKTTISVEILEAGPRAGTVWVQALNGLKPFQKNSHGGPFQENSSIVLIPSLQNIRIENDLEKEFEVPNNRPNPTPIYSSDYFLEGAYEDRTFSE